MLISVLSLGGAILGATTVAGLLTLYQLRAAADSENSAKAIFAADTGMEWAQFDYYCTFAGRCSITQGVNDIPTSSLVFSNGATAGVVCSDAAGAVSMCSSTSTVSALSTGQSGNSRRAFILSLTGATSTNP